MNFVDTKDLEERGRRGEIRPGAVWDIHWNKRFRPGPDGKRMRIWTPCGGWNIDEQSSSCTKKYDDNHHCWVRTGSIAEGTFTVGKKGNTCESGAGSVRFLKGKNNRKYKYHARIMNNYLVEIPFF